MKTLIFIQILGILIVIIAYHTYKRNKKINIYLKNNYGKFAKFHLTDIKIEQISKFFNMSKPDLYVDEITYRDLDFDKFYSAFNSSISCIGNEYTYRALRDLILDEDKLKKRDKLSDYFNINSLNRMKTQKTLFRLSSQTRFNVFEKIKNLGNNKKTIWLDILLLTSFLSSVAITIYNDKYGFFVILTAVINIVTYLTRVNGYDDYFEVFKIVVSMRQVVKKILSINESIIIEDNKDIERVLKKLKKLNKIQYLTNGQSNDIISIILSYINMVLHIDIIAAYIMLKSINKNIDDVLKLYEVIGEVEFALNISSFRSAVNIYTKPIFDNEKKIVAKKIVHPLLPYGVRNDIDFNSAILITGSNASGKSTFLKTIALNQILSQTIYTSTAESYTTAFFNVKSSMALRDDLFSEESYFMVEIKSIKRLLDESNKDIKLLCFIDEILRGTNTIERICASKVILKELSKRNCLCMTATHDIELTYLLEDTYKNYNFKEELIGNDVKFDYKLNYGRSTTRNAIALLKVMGFEKDIINSANEEVMIMEGINETV